jgi:hypothetical protein
MRANRVDGGDWWVVDKTSTAQKIAVKIRLQEADLQKSIHPLMMLAIDATQPETPIPSGIVYR